jgi:hypothetical protein
VPLARVWACTMAATLTVFGTLGLRAAQPAAVSATLLIASGIMQTWRDGVVYFREGRRFLRSVGKRVGANSRAKSLKTRAIFGTKRLPT